jgi:O-succinylbenzoic acid--CoA ligase
MKWVALAKSAFLASAQAVNTHLQSDCKDRWANALPLFHVGGLSIYARAFLSGASVYTFPQKWDPITFHTFLHQHAATLTALVPTQLFDLIQNALPAPKSLRAAIIGGGHLHHSLFQQAQALGWAIAPSYGMTECASQIATALALSSDLQVLPHIQYQISEDQRLRIKSCALFTGYLECDGKNFTWSDPKQEGWFTTEDCVQIDNNILQFLGRANDWIKISGENVSLLKLEKSWEELKPSEIEAVIVAAKDERLGAKIELLTLPCHASAMEPYIALFNAQVMPYERIRNIRLVDSIPRNALGKVLKTARE